MGLMFHLFRPLHLTIFLQQFKLINMKTITLYIAVVFAASLSLLSNTVNQNTSTAVVQATLTVTFKVWGKCDMCKTRIEKTARAEGATNAEWDTLTQMLTVTYDPSKTNKDALSKKLAAVGHDTEKYKAPDDVYAKLPGCCHYERAGK